MVISIKMNKQEKTIRKRFKSKASFRRVGSDHYVNKNMSNNKKAIRIKKIPIRRKAVVEVFKKLKKNDLIEDRREYDVEDLQSAYPSLTKTEAKLLYLKIQKEARK